MGSAVTQLCLQEPHQLSNEVRITFVVRAWLDTWWVFRGESFIKVVHISTYVDNMMIGDDVWYAEPDTKRKSWVLLTVNALDGGAVEWRVAYANSHRIVKHERISEHGNEHEAFKRLVDNIRGCARGTILITYSRGTLPFLRCRIIEHNARVSLRGFRHLCIEDLLDRYFGGNEKIDDANQDHVKLWKLLKSIGPLVPDEVLTGEFL